MKFIIEVDPQNPQDITDAIEALMRLELDDTQQESTANETEETAGPIELPNPLQFGKKEPLHMEPDNTTNEVVTGSPPLSSIIEETTKFDVELDSEGLPWDSRIHVDSKAKIRNGTWRTKRKNEIITDEYIKKIKDELRGVNLNVNTEVNEEPNAAEIFGDDTEAEPTQEIDPAALVLKLNDRKVINPNYLGVYTAILEQFGVTLPDLFKIDLELLQQIDVELDSVWNNMQG
jgi:anion-transporting  ArsA/GET3 family ATPase